MRHWLMKSEPGVYGIDHLERDRRAGWEGVRNFQARNFMRDAMRIGDRVLFYHSSAKPSGVAGTARVCAPAHPDPTQFDRKSKYHDPAATLEDPRWVMVDIEFVEKFSHIVPLEALKQTLGLENMVVTRRGSRLSVQPVTHEEYAIIVKLGRKRRAGPPRATRVAPDREARRGSDRDERDVAHHRALRQDAVTGKQ